MVQAPAHTQPSIAAQPAPIFHPAWRGLVGCTVEPRADDDETATAQTIRQMVRCAIEDSRTEIVRAAAYGAIGEATEPRAIAERIFAWVKEHVRLVDDSEIARAGRFADPDSAEVLVRPSALLRMEHPEGDCDCFSMLTAAMLRVVGIPACFCTITADPKDPTRYSHVYTIGFCPSPLALDTSHGPRPGWSAIPIGKARTWPAEEEPMVRTLGEAVYDPDLGSFVDWNYSNTPSVTIAPSTTPAGGAGLGTDLAKLFANTAASIAKAQWAQPAPGTYIQTGPQGSTYYRQDPNSSPLQFQNLGGGAGMSTLIVVVIIALVLMGGIKLLKS